MNNKEKLLKRFNFIMIFAGLLMAIGTVLVCIFIKYEQRPVHDKTIGIMGSLTAGVLLLFGFLLFYFIKQKRTVCFIEWLRENNQVGKICCINNLLPKRVSDRFFEDGFYKTEGFLHKNIENVHCTVAYYTKRVRLEDDWKDKVFDYYHAMHMVQRFGNIKGARHRCMILFIYKNDISNQDLEVLKELSIKNVIKEKGSLWDSTLLVLIHSNTNNGYYYAIENKHVHTIYGEACRLLEKLFVL